MNNISENPKQRLKKIKKPIKRNVPQMANGSNAPRQPVKIKRPVRKVQPQLNIESSVAKPAAQTNPFQQASLPAQQGEFDVFAANPVLDLNRNQTDTNKSQDNYSPSFISEENDFANNKHKQQLFEKKIVIAAAAIAFVVGFILANLFGGEQKVTHSGLQGVVVNAEIPQGRSRCGKALAGQGCILYIMNPQRQELSARDFYDTTEDKEFIMSFSIA